MESPQGKIEDISVLISQAEALVEKRNQEALPLAEKIMNLAVLSNDPKHYAQAKYILAFYNCLVANNYAQAIGLCEDILKNLDEEELSDIIYKVYMTLGNWYQLKGDVFSAEQSYMKGLRNLENRSERSRTEEGFLASFYYNLSLVLGSSALGMSSEEYLEKAIVIYKALDNSFKLSKSYLAYADIFEKRKEYSKAIDILYKSLEIDVKLNDPYGIALSKANLAVLYLRTSEHTLALEYIAGAFQFFTDNKMAYETAMTNINYSEVLYATGNLDSAINRLIDAEKLFGELNNKQELNQVYELLSDYLREKKDFEAALEYHRKYSEGLKYFFDVEKTNALTRAKKEFESDQKEKETSILRAKNEEIKHYVGKLEQSNNQLHQFASVASHDLREPLRMISSYIALLQKTMGDGLTAQQGEFMSFIKDGAKRMDRLIMDLLQLAKVDANPRPEEVNLNVVLQEIKMNIGVLLEEKKATIIYPELPKIMVDRAMILQLFQNLVGNGIKYNESGSPVVKVNYRQVAHHLELTVTDNGIGIPANLREKAFMIFQRLHTSKQYSGTGIGLAICKKVVESMDGTISISDHKGGGTVFTILLPTTVICPGKEADGVPKTEPHSLLPLLNLK